jgi:hypothetical protein
MLGEAKRLCVSLEIIVGVFRSVRDDESECIFQQPVETAAGVST